MGRNAIKSIFLVAAAILLGVSAWSGDVLLLPLAVLFPWVWSQATSRKGAVMTAAAYFLAASRGLPQGIANFYGSGELYGYGLWITASSGFVLVHAGCWTQRGNWARPARYAVASVLMGLPPIGIVGWAHPLTAAGVLFPGWGWLGLFATAIGILVVTTERYLIAFALMGCFWVCSSLSWTMPPEPEDWTGLNTFLGRSLGRGFDRQQHEWLAAAVNEAAAGGSTVVVLPESGLGFWTPTVERYWRAALEDSKVAIFAGATIVGSGGYDNAMIALHATDGLSVYHQRMPVPVSMWQPWLGWTGKSGGARAHLFANPIVSVAGRRVATLVCYEQLITWPILQSMVHKPELIVATGNGWWTTETSIVSIQRASAVAWASLFKVPIVFAFNT